jgi:hypothetical protein
MIDCRIKVGCIHKTVDCCHPGGHLSFSNSLDWRKGLCQGKDKSDIDYYRRAEYFDPLSLHHNLLFTPPSAISLTLIVAVGCNSRTIIIIATHQTYIRKSRTTYYLVQWPQPSN